MKKLLVFILTVIIMTSMASVCRARDGEVYDKADIFSESTEHTVSWSLNSPTLVTQGVFIYAHEDEIISDLARFKYYSSYVALLIDVDENGDFEAARVESDAPEAPSEKYIDHYLKIAIKLMKKGEYKDAITNFFSVIGSYIDRMHLASSIDRSNARDELEAELFPEDSTDYTVLYLGIAVSAVIALIVAARYVTGLKKQLKTVKYSKDATPYINKEYTIIKSQLEERGIWDLL